MILGVSSVFLPSDGLKRLITTMRSLQTCAALVAVLCTATAQGAFPESILSGAKATAPKVATLKRQRSLYFNPFNVASRSRVQSTWFGYPSLNTGGAASSAAATIGDFRTSSSKSTSVAAPAAAVASAPVVSSAPAPSSTSVVSSEEGPVVVVGGSPAAATGPVRPPYRPPVRSPFRPPPRPPF